MPASSASRSIDSSSSDRVASSRTPRSSSWARRCVRASAGCAVWRGHGPHPIDTCSITPVRSAHDRQRQPRRTPRRSTSSSAPASPDSAPRSSCRRTARPTSSSSRRAPTSAAPGATTPTPAPPATSRASSTRSPSRPTPTGRCRSPRSRRSRPTSAGSPSESGTLDRFALRHHAARTPPGTTTAQRWDVRDLRPAGAHRHLDHPDRRRRRALRAEAARHRRHRRLPGRRSSTPPAGTTTSTSPASGSR